MNECRRLDSWAILPHNDSKVVAPPNDSKVVAPPNDSKVVAPNVRSAETTAGAGVGGGEIGGE